MALRFDVLTLMPELFEPHLRLGVTRRAFETRQVDVRLWPLRDFGEGPYRRVDDRPFGGGPGMVMMAEPLERALQAVRRDRDAGAPASAASAESAESAPVPLVHFTPTGRRLDQTVVQEFAAGPGAILLCGRYEGVDQRFLDHHRPLEISLGDYVLSGGELAALALLDAVARLQPGVLHTAASHEQDSFSADGLLDCPHYTRPEVWPCDNTEAGRDVPAVLLSGHHAQIARWRREASLRLTAQRRPDLIEQARRQGRLSAEDERFLAGLYS